MSTDGNVPAFGEDAAEEQSEPVPPTGNRGDSGPHFVGSAPSFSRPNFKGSAGAVDGREEGKGWLRLRRRRNRNDQ